MDHTLWWEHWRQATCMPLNCFCEGAGPGLIRQPINTFSNLGFLLVGLAIYLRSLQLRGASCLRVQMLITTMIFMGLTSILFHAGLTFIGQWLDNLSMYTFASYIVAVNLVDQTKHSERTFLFAFLIPSLFWGVCAYTLPEYRREIFALSMGTALACQALSLAKGRVGQKRMLVLSIISFAIALAAWSMDQQKIWCPTDLPINGHGLWHLLTALSCWFYFLYLAPILLAPPRHLAQSTPRNFQKSGQ